MFNSLDGESELLEISFECVSVEYSLGYYEEEQVENTNFNQPPIIYGTLQMNENQGSSQISQESASTNETPNSQYSQIRTEEQTGLSQQLNSKKSKDTESTIKVLDFPKLEGGSPPLLMADISFRCVPKSKTQK